MRRFPQEALIVFALGGALAACSTYSGFLRQAVQRQPRHEIVLVPLEPKPGAIPYADQVTRLLNQRLSEAGFDVNEVMPRPGVWQSRRKALRSAGARSKAYVLIGRLDQVDEQVELHPDLYEFKSVPAPRCCTDPVKPCAEQPQAFDDLLGMVVNACMGSHRRVKIRSAGQQAKATFGVRLRVLAADTGQTVWEETARRDGRSLDSIVPPTLTDLVSHLAEKVANQPGVAQTAQRPK